MHHPARDVVDAVERPVAPDGQTPEDDDRALGRFDGDGRAARGGDARVEALGRDGHRLVDGDGAVLARIEDDDLTFDGRLRKRPGEGLAGGRALAGVGVAAGRRDEGLRDGSGRGGEYDRGDENEC